MCVQRAKVRVFNQARYVHIGIVYIEPEIVSELVLQPGDHTDYRDVVDCPVFIQNLARQIRHQHGYIGQGYGADDLVEGMKFVACMNALDAAVVDFDPGNGASEPYLSTLFLDTTFQCLKQGSGAAFEVAQFLPKEVVTRAAYAPDTTPDPRRRQVISVIIKFILKKPAPKYFIRFIANPAFDPAGCLDLV